MRIIHHSKRLGFGFVEGFKHAPLPKIEVWRASTGRPVCYPDDARIVAIATDSPDRLPMPGPAAVLDINDSSAVSAWLVDNADSFSDPI